MASGDTVVSLGDTVVSSGDTGYPVVASGDTVVSSGDTGHPVVSVVPAAGVSDARGAGTDASDEGGTHPGSGL